MDRILQGEGPFTAYDLSAIPDKPYAGHTDCLFTPGQAFSRWMPEKRPDGGDDRKPADSLFFQTKNMIK